MAMLMPTVQVCEQPPTETNMEKPMERGVSPSRKAHLALKERLNRKAKRPPPLPVKKNSGSAGRAIDR